MTKLEIETDVKPFTMVKNALIDSEDLLSEHEKLLYIVLLRYGKKAFPSLSTLSKKCGVSKRTAQRTIDSLIEKGLLKKKNRVHKKTGNTSNIYTLIDNDKIWDSSSENFKQGIEAAIVEEAVKIVEAAGMKVLNKEKELASTPAKEQIQAPNNTIFYNQNNKPDKNKSQDEVYTMDAIRSIYNYEVMIIDNEQLQDEIDSVMNILHTTLNSRKDEIRINGESKSAAVVKSKLLNLDHYEVVYAIEKYKSSTDTIKSPTAYMLTLLYNAKEQMNLEITNRINSQMS